MALSFAFWATVAFSFPDKTPEETAKSLHVPEGYEATVFAAEPMVVNPTAVEVDSRGRVWVTEGLNYRFFANGSFKKIPGADKIKILEDTDGDGKADKVTVFADNIYPVPMGLAIQEIWKDGKYSGCRVFTGNSPDLLCLEDTNGDDKADKRYPLLTGFGGYDSDHGVHGMFLGPDGLLYFTQGDGKYGGQGGPKLPPGATMSVTGPDGRKVESFKDGTVLRCNLDGTGLELVATGLRNNYEVTVDSYGRIFCSDNDDDGNHGCRMCWILPGAHYGYHTPGSPRHWGEENPANMPKLVGTGNGSPCGIMVYEGDMLPPECRGAVLQVDAGTRQINLHPLTKVGASLRTEYKVLVKGDDPQFRPVDCCTAPDGSLMIADWYDAGVGGHRFTDQKTGRIYRLAKKGMKYEKPKVDMTHLAGVLGAMGSPNVTTSVAAARAAKEFGGKSTFGKSIIALPLTSHQAEVQSRRAFLSEGIDDLIATKGKRLVGDTASVMAEMIVRMSQRSETLDKQVKDVSPQPKFVDSNSNSLSITAYPSASLESLLLFRRQHKVGPDFLSLIEHWDGSDRFYLQAIRIGCSSLTSEAKTQLFEALLDDALKAKATNENFALPPYYPTGSNEAYPLPSDPIPPTDARGKLIGVAWVLESIEALPALERLMSERPSEQVNRGVLMALSRFRDPKAADAVFAQLNGKGDSFQKAAMLQLLGDRIKKEWSALKTDARTQAVYKAALGDADLRLTAVRTLPAEFLKPGELHDLIVGLLTDSKQDAAVREAAFAVLLAVEDFEARKVMGEELRASLGKASASPLAMAGISGLKLKVRERSIVDVQRLIGIIRQSEYPVDLRRRAVQVAASDSEAAKALVNSHKTSPLPEDVLSDARYFLNSHADAGVRAEAAKTLPIPKAAGRTMAVRQLVSMKGDAENGRGVFFAEGPQACGKCHRVQGVGQWVGPDLSAIGEKYPKTELYYHISQPSGAIAFGYQNWSVQLKDGRVLNGLIVEETPERIVLRTATGDRLSVASSEIEGRKGLPTSLMPDKLVDPLKDEQVVDLLEFLSSLRQPVIEAAEYLVSEPYPVKLLPGTPGRPTHFHKLTAGRDGVLDLEGPWSAKEGSELEIHVMPDSPVAQSAEIVLSTAAKATVIIDNKVVATPEDAKNGVLRVKVDLKQGHNDVIIRLASGVTKPSLTTAVISKRPVRVLATGN